MGVISYRNFVPAGNNKDQISEFYTTLKKTSYVLSTSYKIDYLSLAFITAEVIDNVSHIVASSNDKVNTWW